MKKPKGEYSIQTVVNALRLLGEFGEQAELGVTELSRRLSLHKNNVFRLLATLEQYGYIEQSSENESYRLGVACLQLGEAYRRGGSLLDRARPLVESLAGELGESVHLGALRAFDVVHLDAALPDQLVVATSRLGTTAPVHCTALGKVLLGCSSERVRQEYDRHVRGSDGLAAYTPATIVDPDKFFEHIRGVAVRGSALDLEEYCTGVCCAAAPVFDDRGEVVAALSVSGPAARLNEMRLEGAVVPRVTAAAEALSRQLGFAS